MSFSEELIYNNWIKANTHHYSQKSKFQLYYIKREKQKKYIPMPPPNITGKLHMGHGLCLTIEDSLIRFYKNLGFEALFMPGLDHAGLATHEKIRTYAKKKKIEYKEAAQFIEKSHREIILSQIKKLGTLPDWRFLSYTLNYDDFIYEILNLMNQEGRISFKDGQFFLDIKDLAKELLEDLKKGDFKITPSHEIKNLLPFLEEIEPWCISRQIPWGTKFPFQEKDGNIIFKIDENQSLDTWFNSSLWPFAIIKDKKDLKDFYPASLLETGGDILFFWCARMLMMSLYLYKNQTKLNIHLPTKYCFKEMYLHGIIRDKNGIKFSKSLGNGIDPLDMISKYGADATRLFLITRSGAGEDIIFDEKEMISYKKFINKIYQSARFLSMYAEKAEMKKMSEINGDNQELKDIQERYAFFMENKRFLEAARLIHSKYKDFFCDRWIEGNKKRIQELDQKTLAEGFFILDQMLCMLEPFCPFICSFLKDEYY